MLRGGPETSEDQNSDPITYSPWSSSCFPLVPSVSPISKDEKDGMVPRPSLTSDDTDVEEGVKVKGGEERDGSPPSP